MNDFIPNVFLPILIAGVAGFFIGWVVGRDALGADCQRWESFYVSSSVYECKLKVPE